MAHGISRRRALAAGAAGAGAVTLAACGGDGDEAVDAPPEEGEDITGSVVMWTYPLSDSADEEWYEPFIESFAEKYPNVDVQVIQQAWDNREEQLTTAISGGNAPDVVYFNPDFIPRFAEEELLLAMDDLRDDWDAFVPASMEDVTYDDTIYSAPILVQASPSFGNQRILDELGVDPPTNWDELRTVGEAAKAAGYYLLEYSGETTLNHTYYQYLWQAGGEVVNEEGTEVLFNSPEGLEALEFVKEMVDNEWVPTEPISVTQPLEQSELAQGNVAYSLGANLTDVREVLDDDIVVTAPMQHQEQVAIGSVGSLSIFSTSESPDAAAAWVHHLTEPDFIEAVCKDFTYHSPRTDVTGMHDDDPQIQEFEQYIDLVNSGVIHPQAREIIDTMQPHIQAVLLQGKDPQTALDDMESEVNDLLAR